MRFAAVNLARHPPSQQPQRNAGAELIRRLMGARQPVRPASEQTRELPADLDQRVRLIGEW